MHLVKGEPKGGNAMNLNCCMQPKFKNFENGEKLDSNDVS